MSDAAASLAQAADRADGLDSGLGDMIRGILVDLDRTLVDVQTHTDYAAALEALPGRLRVARPEDAPETEWASATAEAMEVLVGLAGASGWQEASDIIERYEIAATPSSDGMPGAGEFLRAISGLPHGVVTLMGPQAAAAALARHRLEVPVVSGRVATQRPKPAPDQFLSTCAALGLDPSETLMVGDSSWDAVGAAAAGCRFLGVTNGGRSLFPAGVDTAGDLFEVVVRLRDEGAID